MSYLEYPGEFPPEDTYTEEYLRKEDELKQKVLALANDKDNAIKAEARAALLEQVLRVVDEAFDAEELRMPLEAVGGALKALYHVRARLAALADDE